MKRLALLLLAALTAHASQLGLFPVKQPLYLHGSDTDPEIRITDVPFASSHAFPEALFSAISTPFVPPTDGSWRETNDVNLASLYRIRVSAEVVTDADPEHWIITIDASGAYVPEGYPFTVEQVVDSVATCVRLTAPARPESERKLTIRHLPPRRTAAPAGKSKPESAR